MCIRKEHFKNKQFLITSHKTIRKSAHADGVHEAERVKGETALSGYTVCSKASE